MEGVRVRQKELYRSAHLIFGMLGRLSTWKIGSHSSKTIYSCVFYFRFSQWGRRYMGIKQGCYIVIGLLIKWLWGFKSLDSANYESRKLDSGMGWEIQESLEEANMCWREIEQVLSFLIICDLSVSQLDYYLWVYSSYKVTTFLFHSSLTRRCTNTV